MWVFPNTCHDFSPRKHNRLFFPLCYSPYHSCWHFSEILNFYFIFYVFLVPFSSSLKIFIWPVFFNFSYLVTFPGVLLIWFTLRFSVPLSDCWFLPFHFIYCTVIKISFRRHPGTRFLINAIFLSLAYNNDSQTGEKSYVHINFLSQYIKVPEQSPCGSQIKISSLKGKKKTA